MFNAVSDSLVSNVSELQKELVVFLGFFGFLYKSVHSKSLLVYITDRTDYFFIAASIVSALKSPGNIKC